MATTTVMFTDVSGSTEALAGAGDEAGTSAMRAHLQMSREVVAQHGGRVVKTLGDGVMALFPSASEGIAAAVALQQSADLVARNGGVAHRLRIGLHVGDLVDDPAGDPAGDNPDVYGLAVVVARRICDVAEPDQILVSELVKLLVGARLSVEFAGARTLTLDGVPEPQAVLPVVWQRLPDEVPVRVVVAEDAALIRAGVVRLLGDVGFDVVADVGDHDSLLAAVRAATPPPDLLITDIRMPPTLTDEGLRAAAELRAEFPSLAVLVLSQHVEAAAALTLLGSTPTAVGYLLKERISDVEEFVAHCRTVAAGGSVIDPIVTEQLLVRHRERAALDALSGREQEVLALMASGASNRAIAASLFCSDKTVESHVRSIFQKLELSENPDGNRRVAAVIRWLSLSS